LEEIEFETVEFAFLKNSHFKASFVEAAGEKTIKSYYFYVWPRTNTS